MSKIDAIKTKLHTDPDSIIMWMDDGSLPHCWYDSEEVSCLRINLMLEGDNDVYVILILPATRNTPMMPCCVGRVAAI